MPPPPVPLFAFTVIIWMLTLLNSLNFNIVSKGLGSNRMSHYISEAASEMRELLTPTLESPKAKL